MFTAQAGEARSDHLRRAASSPPAQRVAQARLLGRSLPTRRRYGWPGVVEDNVGKAGEPLYPHRESCTDWNRAAPTVAKWSDALAPRVVNTIKDHDRDDFS
jgi:hypothetical protein